MVAQLNKSLITKTLSDIHSVIDLYKSFPKYNHLNREELFFYLQKPISMCQSRIFYEDGKVVGFLSWAYFNKKTENHFKRTGEVLYWKGGKNIWIIDILSKKDVREVIKYAKTYFSRIMKIGQRINYLRMNEHNRIIKYSSQSNKEFYK